MTENELTERELMVLEIERRRWRYPAHKEQAIRDMLDISTTRYYQILNSLLRNPKALATHAVMLNRLHRALA